MVFKVIGNYHANKWLMLSANILNCFGILPKKNQKNENTTLII